MNKCRNDDKIHTRTMGAGVAEGLGVAEEVGVEEVEEVEVGVLVSVFVMLTMSGSTVVR